MLSAVFLRVPASMGSARALLVNEPVGTVVDGECPLVLARTT